MEFEALVVLALLALALTLKPWPILTGILLAAARRGRLKATAFLAGWVTALALVGALAVQMLPAYHSTRHRSTITPYAGMDLALGLVLAFAMAWGWRRPRAESERTPGWVRKIDSMSALVAFVLGVFMPSYLLIAAAVNQLLLTGWSGAGKVVVMLLFVVVASAGVALPVVLPLVRPDDAAAITERWREWLLANRRALGYSMTALIAALLVAKGLLGLVVG
ncbi:GAP family protein [Actinomadura gamaensis]|uniref:GAP family protein n=1 Tax=Actinomadura gamaensis TaxID=1763541 RepID=A0ABV9U1Y4_9ACTN